jgi:hypothetical protein
MSLNVPVPSRGQPRPEPRLPALGQAGCRGRQALKRPPTVNPRILTVDKNVASPKATRAMKQDGELWRFAKLRQVRYLNNIVEIDQTWCLFKSKWFKGREDTDDPRFGIGFGELAVDQVRRDRRRSATPADRHSCRAAL